MDAAKITFACKTPANVADTLARTVCVQKTNTSIYRLIVLGIFAGAYISFGACLATLVGHDAAKFVGVGLAKLITGISFSVGLMLVVIAGAELFTGNNLILMSVLDREVSASRMISNWVVVYAANLAGSLLVAFLFYSTLLWKMNSMGVGVNALEIANAKVNLPFWVALTRGILCNWLVCLAVWMALASQNIVGKIFSIMFPIAAFVALGFEHSVANMYFIPMGLLLKGTEVATATTADLTNLTPYGFVVTNLIPVTIGNIIGGALCVGALYWSVYVRGSKKPA